MAHFGPITRDDTVSDTTAVLLCDVLPTAWQAVEYADVPVSGTVVVYGRVRDLIDGRGADSVIDAVGMDADGSFADKLWQTLKIQPDRMAALHQALGSVRRGGTVSVIGVYGGWMPSFPIGDLFDKQVTLRWARPTHGDGPTRSPRS